MYVILTDPDVLAQVVRAPGPLLDDVDEADMEADDEPGVDWHAEYERLRPLLDRLPADYADTFEMYYFRRKQQQDIATVLGITQAAVSYRLHATRQRLKFLRNWPGLHLTEDQVRKALEPIQSQFETRQVHGSVTVSVLWSMLRTTSQTQTSRALDIPQSVVGYRFHHGIEIIDIWRSLYEELEPIHTALVMVAQNPNILTDTATERSHRGHSYEHARRTSAITRQHLDTIDALHELERLTR